MAVLNDIQRAKNILDILHSADTATGVDATLARRIGDAIALVRRGIPIETLTDEQRSAAILWEFRQHIKQILADAEGNAAAAAAKIAAVEDVDAIDLGSGGEPGAE